MKKTIISFLLLLAACQTQRITPYPFPQESDEVLIDEPLVPARTAAEPDFWDPNYRNRVIVQVAVEVAYDIFVKYGANTESVVRNAYATSSVVMESACKGVRLNVVSLKINKKPNRIDSLKSASQILYQWSASFTANPAYFYQYVTNKNIGGLAFVSQGNVTSARFSVVGWGNWTPGNATTYTLPIYVICHELGHNLGLRESHNGCAWLSKTGVRLGRLDSCAACQSTCTPVVPNCNGSTKRMNGSLMSYCHVYLSVKYELPPPILAVLNRAIYRSNLPKYQ